jgi:hypothetical protein
MLKSPLHRGVAAIVLALAAMQAEAAAQTSGPPAPAMLGSELATVTLPAEQLVIAVPIVINLSKDQVTSPINVPVDVYYGVSDNLMLGLSHSNATIQGLGYYGLGLGLCLTGDGCGGHTYNNVAADVVYRIAPGTVQLAIHSGLDFNQFVPDVIVRLRLGMLAKAPLGTNVALLADPRLAVGLTERSDGADILTVPLAVQFLTSAGARFAVQTGIDGALADFASFYTAWLGVFGALGVNEKIEAFASFTFPNLYGKNGGVDARILVLGLNIRP